MVDWLVSPVSRRDAAVDAAAPGKPEPGVGTGRRRWPGPFGVGPAVIGLAVGVLVGCGLGPTEDNAAAEDAGGAVAVGDGDTAVARFDAAFTQFSTDPADTRARKQFRDAFQRIRDAYVSPVSDAALVDAALAGLQEATAESGKLPGSKAVDVALDAMTASLDPHSAYLDPDELREAEVTTTGEFGGLGIQVAREEGQITVISPIEGTPADRAGIKPGDRITHVDGVPVGAMSLSEAVRAMRGEPGTPIDLTIARDGRKPFDVTIIRAVISIEPVRWSRYGDIGYLRIVGFSERTRERVEEGVGELAAQSDAPLAGVVLDLRNNPGGLFDQSLHVADLFLDDGVIVSVKGRRNGSTGGFRARPGDLVRGLPVVVLINGGSASASEIVAGALQDNGRAVVMGAPTFGKGSVQTVIRLPQEGALKLTTALYYAPSGRTIQARGIVPDIRLDTGTPQAEAVHEADLPHALAASGEPWQASRARIDAATCPPLTGSDDPELACAAALVHAGSLDRFLATVPRGTAALDSH